MRRIAGEGHLLDDGLATQGDLETPAAGVRSQQEDMMIANGLRCGGHRQFTEPRGSDATASDCGPCP